MKPTKRQRHEIYKNLLVYIEENGWTDRGFCWHLFEINPEIEAYSFGEDTGIKENYPELWEKGPKKVLGYWFATSYGKDEEREYILKLAIEETKPK